MLEKILNQKAMITTILVAVLIGGIISYLKIGKLEDAEIPIKSAMVLVPYPGATAYEVELEVTDVMEKAIQKLENIDEISSVSKPGLSLITIKVDSRTKSDELPQLWDHLRRKVNDAKSSLPSGAMGPIVNDDFADVYGILYAITGDGFSYTELEKYTKYIEKELLSVAGVRRSQIFGEQTETVEIILSPEKLASLNINPLMIAMEIQNQGAVVNPGSINSGDETISIGIGNKISSIEDIEELLINIPGGGSFKLGEIAEVKSSFLKPKRSALIYNNQEGFALGLSNESGVNIVKVGERIDEKLAELKEILPVGIDISPIYYQPDRVDAAVKDFILNLIFSVGIVMVVLMFAMGWRSGLLISSGLVFTIMGTLIVMLAIDLPMHRISLAAIILAMGMLVDNSIVVADGILVDLKRKVERRRAFVLTAQRTALPLLGATLVAIFAFLPLRMAPNSAGEFLSSLFTVLVISLLLSWLFAMVQTPFNAKYFYRKTRPKGEHEEAYDSKIYILFKRLVQWALTHKIPFTISTVVVLIIAFYSFRFVTVEFMPKLDYDQFVVEYNLPEGSEITAVERDIIEMEKVILEMDGVESVTGAVGRPPARYALMRPMPSGGQTYGELIVETENYKVLKKLMPKVNEYLVKTFPNANIRLHEYGAPFSEYGIEAEFRGPDPAVLRQLSEEAKDIFHAEPYADHITDNWKNKVKKLVPEYSVNKAQKLGLTRSDMGNSILVATDGMPIGVFYEGDKQVPVVLKTTSQVDGSMTNLMNTPVWGQRSQSSTPLAQITDTIEFKWVDARINRINGTRAILAQCDPIEGVSVAELFERIKDDVEAIELPYGYEMEWKGELSTSSEANTALFSFLPLAIGLMLIIVIGLFNNLKQALIVFIIVPFAFIGIVPGLIATGVNLTFVGIIGALGLIGMMIKNSVVLLDEINLGLREGKSALKATIDSAISRMRPVMMASLTTILGMLPLVTDATFQSLAIVIMFGLLAGSLITLVVVPVFYAVLFRVDVSPLKLKK